jgi:DNA-binding transcriptional MocR family regulator
MLKYRSLFERYRDLIATGAYAPGERLPSLRSVAEAEAMGLNTVRAAFGLLEGEGLARPLPRGGYYVTSGSGRARALRPYAAPEDCSEAEGLSASQKMEYLLQAGASAAGFALAEPDAALLPLARLERLHASLSGSWIEYGDQAGEEELRRRIAAFYYPCHGGLESGEILVTNGATEAICIAIRSFVSPGDEVIVESPTYYDYFRQLAAVGARIVEVPVRGGTPSAAGGGMDLDLLAARLKSRKVRMIIVQPNVQNPTGTIMADSDKRRLVELASRSGAILVQDDVYGDLAFSCERPANLGAFGDCERSVYISSFSKCLAPGLRIGWMRSTGLRAELRRTKSLSSLATSRPAQRVLAAYLAGASFRKQLVAMRGSLQRQLDDYLELLSGGLPEGSAFVRPAGGCLLWIALPPGSDSSALFEAAAAEGILFAPGELFSANPFFRRHLRINFGYRLTEKRRADLARLCALARKTTGARRSIARH